MEQFVDILRFMTIGCLILIIIKLFISEIANYQRIPASLFSICVLGYLVVDWEPLQQYPVFYFFLLLAIALPFSFWMFSQSLFNDGFRLRRWMVLVFVAFLLIQFFFYFNSFQSLEWGENIKRIVSVSQHTLPLLFVMLGIISAVRGRDADLIAARFQFRSYFILLAASLIFLTLLSEIAFQGSDVPIWLDLSQKLFLAGLTFFFASYRLIIKPGFFLVVDLPSSQSIMEKPEVDTEILTKLVELMDQQKYWRTEGLTIRRLAETMHVKEYKLRNTINQQLGFRNFNDYLHSFRINESCKLLSNPEQKDVTILEIAYAMGYSSIAPFNKAFKQITNMTPTEWRRSKMP